MDTSYKGLFDGASPSVPHPKAFGPWAASRVLVCCLGRLEEVAEAC